MLLYSLFENEFEILRKKIHKSALHPSILFGSHLLESKGRDEAFHIEGLARLISRNVELKSKHKEALDEINRHAKIFEDILGKMDEYLALEKRVVGHSKKSIDPTPLIHSQSILAHEMGLKTFGNSEWIKEQLSHIRFLKKWKTKKSLRVAKNAIADEIEVLTEKTINELLPQLKKRAFTYDTMEEYFHEFRRNLRWIPIYVQTLKDIFDLTPFDTSTTNAFETKILNTYKNNPFTQVDPQHPKIAMDRFSYYMFSHTIGRSGVVKDSVEMHFRLNELKIKSPLNANKNHKEMIATIEEFLKSGASWRLYDSLLKNSC